MEKIFEKLVELLAKPQPMTALPLAVVVLAIVFVLAAIINVIGSYAIKYRGGAGKVIKYLKNSADTSGINEHMKKMPAQVKAKWRQVLKSRAKPSTVMTVDSCVDTPLKTSSLPLSAMIIWVLTGIFVLILFTCFAVRGATDGTVAFTTDMIVAVVALAIVGIALAFLLMCANRVGYNMTIRKHIALVDILDEKFGSSAHAHHAHEPEPVAESEQFAAQPVHEPIVQEQPVQFEQTHSYEQVVQQESQDEVAAEPVSFIVEEPQQILVTETIIEETTFTPVADNTRNEIEEEIRREKEEAERRATVAEAQAREAETAALEVEKQRQAELDARLEAQRKASEAASAQAAAAQAAAAQARAAAQATAAQAASASSSETEALIARIQQISREGATMPVKKEVAVKLQQERAKPENKTPEMQRKLNEALAMLLKAMQSQ